MKILSSISCLIFALLTEVFANAQTIDKLDCHIGTGFQSKSIMGERTLSYPIGIGANVDFGLIDFPLNIEGRYYDLGGDDFCIEFPSDFSLRLKLGSRRLAPFIFVGLSFIYSYYRIETPDPYNDRYHGINAGIGSELTAGSLEMNLSITSRYLMGFHESHGDKDIYYKEGYEVYEGYNKDRKEIILRYDSYIPLTRPFFIKLSLDARIFKDNTYYELSLAKVSSLDPTQFHFYEWSGWSDWSDPLLTFRLGIERRF